MDEQEKMLSEDISVGKMCPFLMGTAEDFQSNQAICVGDKCALHQTMHESYVETDDNEEPVVKDGQPVVKTKEIKGCSFALSSRLEYMSVMTLSDSNRTGHFVAQGLSKLMQAMTPVGMNKPKGGIVLPRGNIAPSQMGPAR